MSVDAGVLVGRRSRAEIERLVALYGSSGMGRIEFCRSQGLALSTLGPPFEETAEQAQRVAKQGSRAGPTDAGGTSRTRCLGDCSVDQRSQSGSWTRLRCGDAGATGDCAGEVVSPCSG